MLEYSPPLQYVFGFLLLELLPCQPLARGLQMVPQGYGCSWGGANALLLLVAFRIGGLWRQEKIALSSNVDCLSKSWKRLQLQVIRQLAPVEMTTNQGVKCLLVQGAWAHLLAPPPPRPALALRATKSCQHLPLRPSPSLFHR